MHIGGSWLIHGPEIPVVSFYAVTTVNSALRALEVLGLSESPASSFKVLVHNFLLNVLKWVSSYMLW
jgi:hypothetical protein